MRLLDRVAQASEPFEVALNGEVVSLPGPADCAQRVRDTALRFVLNDDVRAACDEILELYPMVLDPGDPLLRLPDESMWLEWPLATARGDALDGTAGLLVEGDEDGRSGTITGFWAPFDGAVEQSQARIIFDLDTALRAEQPEKLRRFYVKDRYLLMQRHAVVEIFKPWREYFDKTAGAPANHREIARNCAEAFWGDLPLLLAFLRLLSARGAIERRPVERAALNKARDRKARPPLLDHFELVLRIGEAAETGESRRFSRGASRRHLVRGHVVHRRGQIFWRSSHYRGTIKPPVAGTRTTKVVMAKGFRYQPEPVEMLD